MNLIEILSSNYDLTLVVISIMVVIFSAFVALDISSRLKVSTAPNQIKWILSGAFILGLGIWAMHFIAMLAFHLSIEVTYNVGLVILSILPALISCAIAFYIISKPSISRIHLLTGSFFIGTGIISMHYLGMEAMQMQAIIIYDTFFWVLSGAIAFATSFVALYLLFSLSNVSGFHWRKIVSAIIMGMAVAGMHYTGMAAAFFEPAQHHANTEGVSLDSTLLAYGVGAGMLLTLGLAFYSVRFDRKIKAQSDAFEQKFQSVIESANDAIIITDDLGTIIQWNQGAQIIFGYSKEEVLGLNIDVIVPERFKEAHRKGMERYRSSKISHVIGKTVELTGYRKDGCEFPIEMSLGTWETETEVFFSSIIRDITERKNSEEKINGLVYLDSLTGLPNRSLFNDRFASTFNQANEHESLFSLLYLNLDRFKLVNDTFGHTAGDQLLVEVANRLQNHATVKDTLSRLGGNEFIFLLPHTDYSKAAEFAQNLINAFKEPFQCNGEDLFITLSMGISMFPSDGQDQDTLMKNADIAMYRVKENGKNGFQFFTPEMNKMVSRKSRLAFDMRKSLEFGDFFIHYQPQIELQSEKIIGVEALIRWTHRELGNISPAEFIPIAEETGFIVQIGEFVLQNACQQNKSWQEAGLPHFRVAVNISARQFSQSNLPESVFQALEMSGLAPHYLELELTESIIQRSDHAIATMRELKSMGLHLSIDDFGTGYSSLSYLKLFPIDTLKIDQHFTRNIQTDEKDAAIVNTIIRMAHDLGLMVIAEGVETVEQLEFLRHRKCDQAQGYYFNRPLPPEEIERIYRETERNQGA